LYLILDVAAGHAQVAELRNLPAPSGDQPPARSPHLEQKVQDVIR
jgi:hypothetical protein